MPLHGDSLYDIIYEGYETELAKSRYCSVTGHTKEQFWDWLGFNLHGETEDYLRIGVGSLIMKPAIKMDMLLSDHWHVLLKAHLIKEEK